MCTFFELGKDKAAKEEGWVPPFISCAQDTVRLWLLGYRKPLPFLPFFFGKHDGSRWGKEDGPACRSIVAKFGLSLSEYVLSCLFSTRPVRGQDSLHDSALLITLKKTLTKAFNLDMPG